MSEYQNSRLQRKLGLAPALPTKKEPKPLKRISDKRAREDKEEKEKRGENDTELVRWFKARIQYSMKGVCEETGLKTERNIYRYAILSCCHILEKRNFKSVMYHKENFIELLPDIHHKFDNCGWKEREKMSCWPTVFGRLVEVYPSIAPEELHHLPTDLRDRIEKILSQQL